MISIRPRRSSRNHSMPVIRQAVIKEKGLATNWGGPYGVDTGVMTSGGSDCWSY